ncbi:MAG: tRNA-dihydrouridine synthase family protein [Opitutales bacterium]|jgi:nifR3 family TIM-barrel protein
MLETDLIAVAPPSLPWFGAGRCPLYLAPMAGFTDGPFRRLCKGQGADVLVTEFAHAESLLRGHEGVWRDLYFAEMERPLGVQIFGGDPEQMAAAARLVVARLRPDFMDINFGCPADKVTCRHAGSSLLRDLPLLERIARAVAEAAPETPVTAKIRLGWDAQSIVALEAARRLEDAGMRALAVHGRTKEQGYSGGADWETIAAVAEAVTMPVVGNGSVDSPAMAVKLRRETKVAGLMIGRAALGYPWIFREIKAALAGAAAPGAPTLAERWEAIFRYLDERLELEGKGPDSGNLGGMRAALKSLAKGMPDGAMLRGAIERAANRAELEAIAAGHQEKWEKIFRQNLQNEKNQGGKFSDGMNRMRRTRMGLKRRAWAMR